MDILTRDTLVELAKIKDSPCLSIFLSLHKAPEQAREDVLRLRSLLDSAEEKLAESGFTDKQVATFLERPRALLEDEMFWHGSLEGLALFVTPKSFHAYRLPFEVREKLSVSDHCDLLPLLPMLLREGRFDVLAMSENSVRLLRATAEAFTEVLIAGLPKSKKEALGSEEKQSGELQFQTFDDAQEKEIVSFLQSVEKSVRAFLMHEHSPLIVAGVEKVTGLYRKVNTYKHLLQETIAGSPDFLSGKELTRKAWEIVKPYVEREQGVALARYEELLKRDMTSASPALVAKAAGEGRVALLLVSSKAGDAVGPAVIETLLHDGEIVVVPAKKMPEGSEVAAGYRY